MNPTVPYGHIPSIAWGTDRDSLIAEYGRLKRCLSSGTLAPAGKDVNMWRQSWMAQHNKLAYMTEVKFKMATEQMERLQKRLQIVNHSIYQYEVALHKRDPEPEAGPDYEPKKYRDVPLLLREMRVDQSMLGDKELRLNVNESPPEETSDVSLWTDLQIEDMSFGRYNASHGYILKREPPKDEISGPLPLGSSTEDFLNYGVRRQEEEDDPDYMDFLTEYSEKLAHADRLAGRTESEQALHHLQRQRYQLRRIMHAIELEITHHTVRRSELSFQRTEQQRVTHYYCRMNQIRGELRAMGYEADLDAETEVMYDEKRARAATPPPSPEPCLW